MGKEEALIQCGQDQLCGSHPPVPHDGHCDQCGRRKESRGARCRGKRSLSCGASPSYTDLSWEKLLAGRQSHPQTNAPRGEGPGQQFLPPGEGEAGSVLPCWWAGRGASQLRLPSSSCSKERGGMSISQFCWIPLPPENFTR